MKNWLSFLLVLVTSFSAAFAKVKGRIDAGFVDLRMNLLESGNTTNKLWLQGGRVDMTILPFEGYGIALKGNLTDATGNGDIFTSSLGIAHYTPLTDKWTVVPTVGWTYTNLRATQDFTVTLFDTDFVFPNVHEKIRSNSVFIGTDVIYTINDEWMVTGVIQYGWATSKTFLSGGTGEIPLPPMSLIGHSSGFSGAAIVDYYFRKNWSVNVAWGYNSTLSKEKEGLRVVGWKGGLSYTF